MTLSNKVQQFGEDADTLHSIIHGPAAGAGSTVATDGGTRRTLAKIDADLDANGHVATVLAAKAAAEAARDAANTSGRAYTAAQGTAAALADAAVTAGQTFAVVAADALSFTIYRKDAGPVATLMFAQYTKAHFDSFLNTSEYSASGVAWGVRDANDKLALFVKADGSVSVGDQDDLAAAMPGGKLASSHFEARPDGSGYAFAVADASGNGMAFAVLADGTVWCYGKEVASQQQANAISDLTVGTKSIVCWGDSLTEGSGATGGQTYPVQLATLLGVGPILNEGMGSQTSNKILCRQGGMTTLATVAGNSIPAAGGVAVTLSEPILLMAGTPAISIYGYLNGVYGTLSVDGAPGNYTFTRASAGGALITPPNTPFIVTRSTRNADGIDYDKGINLFWVGTNDLTNTDYAQLPDRLELAVRKIKSSEKRFIVLGPITTMPAGNIYHTAFDGVIAALKARFPRNFIDVQAQLLHSYNAGIPQDVTDFGNAIVPSSLRADSLHLNNAGYGIVAAAAKRMIDMKGWLA